jgi:hypothetical protein
MKKWGTSVSIAENASVQCGTSRIAETQKKAALVLRGNINNEVSSPETVNDLLAHYQKYELTPARRRCLD